MLFSKANKRSPKFANSSFASSIYGFVSLHPLVNYFLMTLINLSVEKGFITHALPAFSGFLFFASCDSVVNTITGVRFQQGMFSYFL